MSTILIPIDFSPVSLQSAEYAANYLQKNEGDKIIFYHSYFLVDVDKATSSDIGAEAKSMMREFADTFTKDFPDCHFATIVDGFQLLEGIRKHIKEQAVDFIVMGINGKGSLTRKIFGSNTIAIVHDTHLPVLIIPQNVEMKVPESVALALPFKNGLLDFVPVDEIRVFMQQAKLQLKIVTINNSTSAFDAQIISDEQNSFLEKFLEFSPEFHQIAGNASAQALIDFAEKENVEWICTVSEEHNLWHRLFVGSVTTELAYHSKKPILVFDSL